MFSLKRTYWYYKYIKSEFFLMSFGLIITFIAIALYSYHPHDSSLVYYTNHSKVIHNWCGFLGAHVAALLLYLFGSASLGVVLVGYFIFFLRIYGIPWKNEWERIGASVLLIVVMSSFSYFYQLDFLKSSYPGGLVGDAVINVLMPWFGSAGVVIILYAALYSIIVLLTRCSFVVGIMICTRIISSFFVFCKKYRLIYHMWRSVKYMFTIFMIPFWKVAHMIQRFFLDMISDDHSYEYEHCYDSIKQTTITTMEEPKQDIIKDYSSTSPVVAESWYDMQSVVDEIPVVNIPTPSDYQSDGQKKSYMLPDLDMFIGVPSERYDTAIKNELEERARLLQDKLERFGVSGKVISIKRGPVVTLFEYQPHVDTKLSRILNLEDDLAMALQALSIRIIAPIPGRSVVGFEVANNQRKNVLFDTIVQSSSFKHGTSMLPLILGEDTIGDEVIVDLARMPHLLIAGSTGSGKSVALNTMLMSLLCARKPDELKLILIDPKRLEFVAYADIAHLLFPIVTDPKKVASLLRWLVKEMEERYEKMATKGARNITDYNNLVRNTHEDEPLPCIVLVIDELADLMMTAGREIEDLITRIAQMARAAGIHMIVATQRPSVDVITGLIKVNFPSRISFRVTSRIDSRIILDTNGAEKLLGRGDMLFLDALNSTIRRVHGAYVSNEHIINIVSHIKLQQQVQYKELIDISARSDAFISDEDEQLYQVVLPVVEMLEYVSISLLQRKFRIGYNRSARIIDLLESRGVIFPSDGGKLRKVVR